MPLEDAELLGTEKEGSKNHTYCKYCYENGAFVNPGMTMEEMQLLITDTMEKKNIPEDIIEAAVSRLPLLQRWKMKEPVRPHHKQYIL
jgi:hypothetical protein